MLLEKAARREPQQSAEKAAAARNTRDHTTSVYPHTSWAAACLRPIVAAYGVGSLWVGSARREMGRSAVFTRGGFKRGAHLQRDESEDDTSMHSAGSHGLCCGEQVVCTWDINTRTPAAVRGWGEGSAYNWFYKNPGINSEKCEYLQISSHFLARSRMRSDRDGENGMRRCDHGPRQRRRSNGRTSITTTAVVLILLCSLSGDLLSFGPRSVQGAKITPVWEWDGQQLYLCDVPKADAETQCQCYVYDPNAVVKCQTTPPEEPEAFTEPGQQRSCTHDPKVQYECLDPANPVSLQTSSGPPISGRLHARPNKQLKIKMRGERKSVRRKTGKWPENCTKNDIRAKCKMRRA